MPGVKRSLFWIFLVLTGITAAACSKSQLSRFAPPGIIKYEDIASEKPQNPAIQERISERKDSGEIAYPVIARTPGPKDRPTGISDAEREATATDLTAARDELRSELDQERLQVLEDQAEAEAMRVSRDNLADRIEREAADVEKLRRDAASGEATDDD